MTFHIFVKTPMGYPIHNEFFCPDEGAIKVGILTEVWGVLKIMEALKDDEQK